MPCVHLYRILKQAFTMHDIDTDNRLNHREVGMVMWHSCDTHLISFSQVMFALQSVLAPPSITVAIVDGYMSSHPLGCTLEQFFILYSELRYAEIAQSYSPSSVPPLGLSNWLLGVVTAPINWLSGLCVHVQYYIYMSKMNYIK